LSFIDDTFIIHDETANELQQSECVCVCVWVCVSVLMC